MKKRQPMHKGELLAYLAGTTCPICQKTKAAYVWTCTDCYRPHSDSPEHYKLSNDCDEHMKAADAFIVMVRNYQTKPESE